MDDVNFASSKETRISIGDDIGLTNKDPTLKKIMIGAGWDVKSFEGEPPDLDISALMLDKDKQTRMDEDFVFYNNMKSENGEVVHHGDSRTGAGEGDDENIEIDLNAIVYDIGEILLVLSIYEGDMRDHDFSLVKNTFIRIVNHESGEELVRLNIPDEYLEKNRQSGEAMIIGRIFRDGPKWRFHVPCTFEQGGLHKIGKNAGLMIV